MDKKPKFELTKAYAKTVFNRYDSGVREAETSSDAGKYIDALANLYTDSMGYKEEPANKEGLRKWLTGTYCPNIHAIMALRKEPGGYIKASADLSKMTMNILTGKNSFFRNALLSQISLGTDEDKSAKEDYIAQRNLEEILG